MEADGMDGYPTREDRIVAEFGDGLDVEGIALRHGLTVKEVYAVIEREVGRHGHYGPPMYQAPPPGFPPPPPGFLPPPPDEDAIVADYGDGYDVEWIARKHGITTGRVYEVVLRVVDDEE